MNTGDNKYKHGKISLSGYLADRYMFLDNYIQNNLFHFYANLKLKPNDTCICGSGQKFVDCCKHKVS